jgi:hypothetical protein
MSALFFIGLYIHIMSLLPMLVEVWMVLLQSLWPECQSADVVASLSCCWIGSCFGLISSIEEKSVHLKATLPNKMYMEIMEVAC